MAVKTGVTIFLLAHTTKVKATEEPELNDIRDSSFIAQEADIVLMVWRDREKNSKISHVKVDKNRRIGNLATVDILLNSGRFYESGVDFR